MSTPEYKKNHPADPATELIGDHQDEMKIKVKRAQLKVIKGPDKGLTQTIPLHGLIVGKGPSASFVLTDPAVSSEHFRLTPTDQGFHIQDLRSSNGTWLQKNCLVDAYIGNKTKIEIGYSTLRLELIGGHEEYPLSRNSGFGEMIGQSVAMRQVFAMLERAAMSDSTLLVEGESGTGKELAAENVHAFSERKDQPLVIVDCGSIQPNLVESHLFGHLKGSFTGATSNHIGAFEAAQGGTVFLDEIGELDTSLQPKLLRVLEKRQVQRLGETSYRPVDVRVIAATNRDLESEVETGQFRQDLFYRLSVLRVHLPPLRDRADDISNLANAIIQQLSPDSDPHEILSDEVVGLLRGHNWPGNVRELRNVIERLLVFPEWPAQAIKPSKNQKNTASGGQAIPLNLPFHDARALVVDQFEKEYLLAILEACKGIVAHAAKRANIPRQTFHRLLKKHGITK